MSLPGFESGIIIDEQQIQKHIITIPIGSEWRIEIPFKSFFKFKVISGIAEINGTELPNNTELQLSGTKLAIYSPKTSQIGYFLVDNKDSIYDNGDNEFSEYLSNETNMSSIINLSMFIESRRQLNKSGPRILIVGGKFSGKSSLAKILSSYSLKLNNSPILVNLNPRDGVFSLPGSLTATPISDSFDIEAFNGYGLTTTTGTSRQNPKQPIVKNYGFTNYKDNLDLYKYQVSRLAVSVLSRLENDPSVNKSGIIIDTPPINNLKNKDDVSLIETIITDFQIDIVVVIGNEKLTLDLKNKFKHKKDSINIIKINKSQGCVELSDRFIRMAQEQSIKEYFHGTYKNRLSPFKIDIDLEGLKLYKFVLTKDFLSTMSFLPAGDEETENTNNEENILDKYYQILEDPSSSNLENSLITITHLEATNNSPGKDLLDTSVLGFVHISKVDDEKKKIKVLLPFPGVFPKNNYLISTNIGYSE
ncbi:unnamed protein product [Candida verbasci]|uniref:Polynucleotide 5'-hydroxyl-kinase GRC3 n=1 Tax=Candida verbasci TaxID=1227364 RepID=A0A9W4TXN1_9ASCO|nr:unnamed protein product [Candida verbasci]